MAANGYRGTSATSMNDVTQNYINQLQNHINQLQQEVRNLQQQQNTNAPPPEQPAPQPQQQSNSGELSMPVRRAEIGLVDDKKQVIKARVDPGTSRIFMNKNEKEIYIKSVSEDGAAMLYPYYVGDPEDASEESDYVKKEDLKSFFNDAVQSLSQMMPPADSFVRKDEIKDLIAEAISSTRIRKKEE